MVPHKDGGANEGHSCVKGRFAWGYATHKDRMMSPMVRDKITDPWREVGWDEAIAFAADRLKAIQKKYGRGSIGAITSSRCTNEEVFVIQKMVRAAFENNNVDTCARVCHSPTGYGLKTTFGTSAGTQDFKSVAKADVIVIIGANPTDAHPVFASRMKRRLREGAKLIIIDPRRIDLVRTPHVAASHHLQLRPGTNVAIMNALAHVIVTEGLVNRSFVDERCETDDFERWAAFVAEPRNSPETLAAITGVKAEDVRAAARLYAMGGNGAIYYGLGVTEHSQGSTMVMSMANLCMATGNIGREGVGLNPLRGQNNVQGSCDMGSFPHEFSGYRHVSDDMTRHMFEELWHKPLDAEPGLRIPNMLDAAVEGTFKGLLVQGEDIAQSDPNTKHVTAGLAAMECVIVQDLFLNETAAYAHVFFPGASFLEKDGTFTNAERRINRVRPAMRPKQGMDEWQTICKLSAAMGYPMHYNSASEIMDEIARVTPTFKGVSFARLDELGSVQWPCNDAAPAGTPIMHIDKFVRGKGRFMLTEFVPTEERSNRSFPLLLTTGRILSQYNVGAQTRRTANVIWHEEDVLEIHPHDAELRGVNEGDLVSLTSRIGGTTLHAHITDRVPQGVVYTTFHFPATGTNVITTEFSDWATNCPEYKVTAVQVVRSNNQSDWQTERNARETANKRPELAKAVGSVPVTVLVAGKGDRDGRKRWQLAEEVPVNLLYNEQPFVVMMATPSDLVDFAWGFSLSEGVLGSPDLIRDVAVVSVEGGILVDVTTAQRAEAANERQARSLEGRSGCGLCGMQRLDQVRRDIRPVHADFKLSARAVARAFDDMPSHQVMNRQNHSVHAAAWCSPRGEVLLIREDVGRHNALDKLIGAVARQRMDFTSGFIVMTSRCSFELVQKAAAVGVAYLATVSAPTSLALDLAERAGMALASLSPEGVVMF
ncbi:unnamed protein product, partial [Phaeothamnion confervicola]